MLWLCARFVHLPVESRPPASDLLAITDRVASRRVLIAANQPARSAGIEVGMSATAALLKQPQLRLVERSRAEERRSLRALADWGLQFSSSVCSDIDRWLLWLEVGASLKYFGGLGALLARIEHGIQALQFTASGARVLDSQRTVWIHEGSVSRTDEKPPPYASDLRVGEPVHRSTPTVDGIDPTQVTTRRTTRACQPIATQPNVSIW